MKLCEYGCGNEGNYYLKRSKKWCCSKSYNSCPTSKEKNRVSHLDEKNHRFGKHHTEETKEKISIKNKGNIPWNKNKTNIYSVEILEKIRNSRLGKSSHNKGISHSLETRRKISEALKGSTPWNKGIPHSEETKRKISIKNTGKKRSRSFRNNQSAKVKGCSNPKWNGGYHSNNIPSYDRYSKELTIVEKPERDVIDANILTVICANSSCNKRFVPNLSQVSERVRCLNGSQSGESRIYCSQECKLTCSIFNKVLHQENKLYTDSDYQTFRTFVLERDNYQCEFCGDKATDVHHERPQKIEPFFSLDPDFAWSCCERCHYEKGHSDKCSTGKLANIIC